MVHKDYLKSELVIAAVVMSGEYEIISKDMLAGIELCLDHVNSNGGINGRKVSLDIFDDKGTGELLSKWQWKLLKRIERYWFWGIISAQHPLQQERFI
jgi:hypothetical protein